jgi:hypothetical protein
MKKAREGHPETRPPNSPITASDLQEMPSISIEQDESTSEPDIAVFVRSATIEN